MGRGLLIWDDNSNNFPCSSNRFIEKQENRKIEKRGTTQLWLHGKSIKDQYLDQLRAENGQGAFSYAKNNITKLVSVRKKIKVGKCQKVYISEKYIKKKHRNKSINIFKSKSKLTHIVCNSLQPRQFYQEKIRSIFSSTY